MRGGLMGFTWEGLSGGAVGLCRNVGPALRPCKRFSARLAVAHSPSARCASIIRRTRAGASRIRPWISSASGRLRQ